MTRKVKRSTMVFIGFFAISFLALAFLFFNKQLAFGYVCPVGTTCMSEGSVTAGNYVRGCEVWGGFEGIDCLQYGCYVNSRIVYACSGTDNNCTGSSGAYYYSYDDCINGDNETYSRCCNGGSSEEGRTCGCGTQQCETYDCECTYIGCKRISNPNENCYEYRCDSTPPCIDCNLGECPSPLIINGIEDYKLSNYLSCLKGGSCAGMKYDDCYEVPSTQPTSSVQILPGGSTTLGCSSTTHTGSEINNPIRMRSTHIDPDSSDIEALYIWLKTDTAIPGTPQYIDINSNSGQTGKTYTRNSYGFMMHKEGSNWVPYIPSLVGGGNDKWIKANYNSSKFPILGPNGQTLTSVEIHSISGPGNNITMEFSLDYTDTISNDALRVIDGTYNIFVMANDVFGFTPYDNYGPAVTKIGDYFNDEQIRFYRNWTDSGKDWSFDFTRPEVNSLTGEVTGPTNIRFNWGVGDVRALYAIVGNIYVSEEVEQAEDITNVVLTSAGNKTVVSPYSPQQQGDTTIGNLTNGYIAKAINMGGITQNGALDLNVGANREGSLIYHATVFDIACNTNQSYSLFDIEDWIVTYGGLVYSSGGIDFSVKNIEASDIWSSVNLLKKLNPLYADISSEMYGDASSTPSSLDKSSDTNSFSISPFKGYKVTDYYNDVRNAFERREIGIPNVERVPNPTGILTGNLGGGTIKVIDRIGNLTVGDANPFICDGKGIIFVSEDLIINNEILNSNYNNDACIFVVKGEVIINQGSNSSGGSIGYDEINAYILTNESVTISADTSFDGLYISGGIQSLGGINTIGRYLGLNYRSTHPVLVINHHSKYGIFSSTLIGNPVDMVKIEVGFKPY